MQICKGTLRYILTFSYGAGPPNRHLGRNSELSRTSRTFGFLQSANTYWTSGSKYLHVRWLKTMPRAILSLPLSSPFQAMHLQLREAHTTHIPFYVYVLLGVLALVI